MARYIDLHDQQFGRLTVTSYAGCINDKGCWNCLCSCGKTIRCEGRSLRKKGKVSCGCHLKELRQEKLRLKEAAKKGRGTHKCNTREGKTKAYSTWDNMIQRCTNSNDKYYFNYGGRGITVCDRWRNFSNFLADMGEPESHLTLDRINNDKGYSPDNCKWATRSEQMRNCRSNVLVEFEGKTQTIAEWAEEKGIKYTTLQGRLSNPRWTVKEALTIPPNGMRH